MRPECLISTPATVGTCPRCRYPILAGMAEGLLARVDPWPVVDEPAAVSAGRWTYTLTRHGLVHRTDDRRRDPALAAPILADHDCPRRRP